MKRMWAFQSGQIWIWILALHLLAGGHQTRYFTFLWTCLFFLHVGKWAICLVRLFLKINFAKRSAWRIVGTQYKVAIILISYICITFYILQILPHFLLLILILASLFINRAYIYIFCIYYTYIYTHWYHKTQDQLGAHLRTPTVHLGPRLPRFPSFQEPDCYPVESFPEFLLIKC